MYQHLNPNIEAQAFLLAEKFRTPTHNGLVMRLGQGWENNKLEAIASWLVARHLDSGLAARAPLDIDLLIEELGRFLREQVEHLWERNRQPYPNPQPFMPQHPLTRDLIVKMVRALLELLGTGQPAGAVEARCIAMLAGNGTAEQKLGSWIEQQAPLYTYYPSELTLPLAHDLLRILYPDFEGSWD